MSRWWLCARAVRGGARRDGRVTRLASALVAAAVVDLVLAWTFLETTVVFGAWILLACVMGSAVAAAAPSRAETAMVFDGCGAGRGIAPLLAAIYAVLVCTLGSIVGLAVGFALRAPLVAVIPPHFSNDAHDVLVASLSSVLGAVLVVAVVSLVVARRPPGSTVRGGSRAARVVWLIVSLAVLALGVSAAAGNSATFGDLEMALFLASPLIAFGAAGLASSVLAGLARALRGRGGVTWFVSRNLRSHRMRTVPVLALVTITVGTCAVGAILTSSLHERVEQGGFALELDPQQEWVISKPGGPVLDFSSLCEQMRPEERPPSLCPAVPRPPDRLSPATLGDTSIAMQDPNVEWILLVATLLVTLPLIVIAVGLDRAARAPDDELLDLQGASPSTRRQAVVLTAFLVTLAGSLTGVLVAVLGTAWSISIYNGQVRTAQNVVFPPVPFVAPTLLLMGFVVLVPLVAAGAAALVAPRHRLRLRLDLPQRAEQPVTFA